MRSILIFIAGTALLWACDSSDESGTFNSEKLRGKYKVEIIPLKPSDTASDGWERVQNGLVRMAISSIDMKMSFYEHNKGVCTFGGSIIDVASYFSPEAFDKLHKFTYKVKQDSLLCIKPKGKSKYEEWAIIRKVSPGYDYLQLKVISAEQGSLLNFRKVKGE